MPVILAAHSVLIGLIALSLLLPVAAAALVAVGREIRKAGK